MRILVISDIRGGENSGGRRHGLVCALALAESGRNVTYVSNYKPAFYEDTIQYFNVGDRFELIIDMNFLYEDEKYKDFDLYIGYTKKGAERAALYGKFADKPSVSAIFEARNWVEDIYGEPQHRMEEWEGWDGLRSTILAHDKSHVVDLTRAGAKWTKKWLDEECGDYSVDRMHQIYAIGNNRACDKALIGGKKLVKFSERKDQILFIGRLVDYKGFDKLINLCVEGKLKSKVVFIAGYALSDIRRSVEKKAEQNGVNLQILINLSEEQKFGVIKESKLLLLPSLFEGQGLPLIEASMCLTPCVAYDLPVYHEQHALENRDAMWPKMAGYKDWEDFKNCSFELLRNKPKVTASSIKEFAALYKEKFSVEYLVNAMNDMVSNIMGENDKFNGESEIQHSDSDVSSEEGISGSSPGIDSVTGVSELGDIAGC
tara:strand:- start:23337 stop:24626 length:1290 start_codon:yes stop_codon:yes gene_type:complete